MADLVCWPCACAFVLSEHMAFVSVFCVPCALILIVLTPSILFPDYCFICPTCLPSLPSSFAPFIISLCLQSCASSSSYVPLTCADPALPCLALSCLAKPASCLVFPLRGSFLLLFCLIFYYQNKAHSPAQLSHRLIPSPQP